MNESGGNDKTNKLYEEKKVSKKVTLGEKHREYRNISLDIEDGLRMSNLISKSFSNEGMGLVNKSLAHIIYGSTINNDDELYNKKQELKKVTAELKEAIEQKENTEELYKKQIQTYSELEEQIKIKHILSRINEKGQLKAISSPEFLDNFKDKNQCKSVVLSIDIRRSTELMLKAREPKLFSEFITQLTNLLSTCILDNYGVFDKFTGDGILAFFPTFYSGDDAIIRALKAAEECHKIFEKHYSDSRYFFNVYIKDVGLGIGVDFGDVTIVNTTNELTVVGIPVVYACRLSGAKAGTTILNQGAFLEVQKNYSSQISYSESEIMIKNEGIAGVFSVDVNPSVYTNLNIPLWVDSEDIRTEESVAEQPETKETE